MTDLITRARKEWCEAYLVEFDEEGREISIEYVCCPPEVVAALLDALERLLVYEKSEMTLTVEAIIDSALEGNARKC